MNFFGGLMRRRSASVASERLKILLTHERQLGSQPDLIPILQGEIVKVVTKHVTVDPDKVQVSIERGDIASMLEINIEVPTASTCQKKNDRRQARAS